MQPKHPIRARAALFCGAMLLGATPAVADEAAFLRCRQLSEAMQRLACYDAVALPERRDAPAQTAAGSFGLESTSATAQLAAVESSIVGRFEGWSAGDSIRLANGQVWQVTDGSNGALYLLNPKVTVRRGALGAYYLEFEGVNRSPRVRRVE